MKWKTLETKHFSIHFHDGEEESARRLAPIAEEVHETLVPIIKHEPDLKTNVVLLDTFDYGNGSATVIPDPRVTIYITDWSSNLNPSKYELWLRFVFLHEYVHILHLDIVEGMATPLRWIFGRVIFPNGMEPWFIVEGLATYMETKHSQAGRGRDPRWDMMMRMDILEKNVKTIDQAAVSTVRWPLGSTCYLYGVEFLEYLSETYGEDKLISLAHIYGDFLLAYGIDGAFYVLYGKSLNMLWKEWLDHAAAKYEKQKDGLGKLTEPELVTRSGYYNLKPKWSRDSTRIYYQQRDADAYPNIRAIDLESGQDNKIVEASIIDHNLSLDPTGRKILFTKLDVYKNYYNYKDLCIFDLEKKSLCRLTDGMRVCGADFSPDGARIVFVKNELGTKSLMVMGSDGADPRLLSSYEADVQYFSPRWRPDGKQIAVAKWIPGGEQKIYLVDAETGRQERITSEKGLISEANPCFSPAGDHVFFDSDRTGIVNLYAYHPESKRLFQITSVLGGAMMPDASPDGRKLAYVSYSSKGYDVAVMEVKPEEWQEVRVVSGGGVARIGERKTLDVTSRVTEERNYEIHDYNPIPTLMPKFWLPLDYTNENGARTGLFTLGTDVLGEHRYQLTYGYDWDSEKSQYSFLYVNNQFLPQVVFQFMDNSVPYDWSGSTIWMRHAYGLVAFTLYDNRVFSEWDRMAIAVGYEQINVTNIDEIASLSPPPSLGNINGILMALRYTNARRYAKSISAEDGMDVTLQVSMNSSDLGSNYTYTNYSLDADYFIPTPFKHQVLAPTLYGFYSKGEQLEQSNFSWRYLPIRGYPSTNLRGNKGVLLATEYRFPIWYTEKALMYGYTFFDRVWGDVFYDVGGATFGLVSSDLKLKRSYGLELNIDTLSFWYLGLTLKIGYVKGIDEDGEEKYYFAIRM